MVLKGGNAFDAAVGAGFAGAVAEQTLTSLGGGGFLVARMAGGTTFTIDFRETAPASAHRDMFLDANGDVVSNNHKWTDDSDEIIRHICPSFPL